MMLRAPSEDRTMARLSRRTPTRATKRAPHDHCEWLNDRAAGYCREAATRCFRHPKGMAGIRFTCDAHGLEALDAGKELPRPSLERITTALD